METENIAGNGFFFLMIPIYLIAKYKYDFAEVLGFS